MGDASGQAKDDGRLELVVIVEDNPVVRRTLLRLMIGRARRVREAGRVDHALRILREEERISLMLLDVRLGDESAVRVAAAAARKVPAPPVVAISGSAKPEEAFQLAQHGVRAFIPKARLREQLDHIIDLAAVPPPLEPVLKAQVGSLAWKDAQDAVRDVMVDQALAMEDSQSGAARQLGLTRQALHELMKRRGKD